jgi:hypothetical protein
MIFTKIIEIGLNIQNCIGFYSDPDNLMRMLQEKYEGYCMKCCYVKSINKILRRGELTIRQDGQPSTGTISVTCEITAIAFSPGEIINGCTVINRGADGMLTCETDITSIFYNAPKLMASITRGQIISIRVGGVRYSIGSNKIAINAAPFLPNDVITAYKIDTIDSTLRAGLTNVLDRIAQEEEHAQQIKKSSPAAWETFERLLYCYKDQTLAPGLLLKYEDILAGNIAPNVEWLVRHPKLNLATPVVCGFGDLTTLPEARMVTELPASTVITILLEDYCAMLRTIRENIEIYGIDNRVATHDNLWRIYKKAKFQ